MAYIKVDIKGEDQFVRIVESYRDEEGVSRIRTLLNLGKVNEKSLESMKRMGMKLCKLAGLSMEDLEKTRIKEEGRFNYGYYLVCQKVLSYYGLHTLFNRVTQRHKLSYSFYQVILLMLMERLNDPSSKRSNYFHQQDYLGLGGIQLHHLYRSLDYLAAEKIRIQDQIFQTGRDLFSAKLDVVFYDVTTFYFDSEEELPGALRQKGFGKDGKVGNTQVLFSLLIDKDKQPIAYEVYSGKKFEGHTFKEALSTLKKRYHLDHIIVVADRGMLSKENLNEITENYNFEYILGEKMKMLPQRVQKSLLDIKRYDKEWVMNEDKSLVVRYCLVEHEGRTIIGTWSATRAEKDRKDRQERLVKAEKLLKVPGPLSAKASRYFLKNEETGKYSLNQEKIEKSEQYDGFLAVATNMKDFDVAVVLDQYKHLYQVEHAFRTFKSFLETRPMFHWTDTRIEGHLCLCYLAYAVETFMLNQLKNKERRRPKIRSGEPWINYK